MSTLILIVVLSAVTYRIGRFIALDTMFEGTRATVYFRLVSRPGIFWQKLADLITCPYCITVWIAAAACFAWRWLVEPFEAPLAVWLAVCAGSLVFWRIVDWEPDKGDEDE